MKYYILASKREIGLQCWDSLAPSGCHSAYGSVLMALNGLFPVDLELPRWLRVGVLLGMNGALDIIWIPSGSLLKVLRFGCGW